MVEGIRRSIEWIGKEIRVIYDATKERTTKREIKEAASVMRSIFSQLQTKEAQALLRSLGYHQVNEELEKKISTLVKANKKLLAENKALKEEVKEIVNNGGKRKMKREFFVRGCGYEQFIEIEDMEWPEDIYLSALRDSGSPLRANKDTDLLFLQERDDQENEDMRQEYLERYPDLTELEGKLILVTTKKVNEEGVAEGHESWIYKMEAKEDSKEFFGSLIKLKELMQKNGRKKVAIYPPGWDMAGKRSKKMLEWVFRGSGIECLMHTKKQEGESSAPNRRRGEALIVRQMDKDYAETLKIFKEKIKPDSSGAKAIRTIREGKDGSMVVILEHDSQQCTDDLRKEIKSVGSMKIAKDINYRNITLFINEIDGVTTREEVQAIPRRETGLSEEQLQVSELRRSFWGRCS